MSALLTPERMIARTRASLAARGRLVVGALGIALLATFAITLYVGDLTIPWPDIFGVLTGAISEDSDFKAYYAIHELRLPRTLVGLLVGLGFGLSGVLFQQLVRNPLASPDIIGIASGASASAAICILVLGMSGMAVFLGAFAGALLTATAIYLLAWRKGVSGFRLVLVGIGMAAILNAVVSFLMTRADVVEAQHALVWLTGSLNGASWSQVTPLALCLLVLLPLGMILAKPLRSLQLGDEQASALGSRVELSRLLLILVGVALAAVATAAAGPIAFVAFVSGPIAHRLLKGSGLGLVAAAVVGALVVLLSDLVAQNALPGTQLPVGVVTGAIGAPYLIWLLVTANRSGEGAA